MRNTCALGLTPVTLSAWRARAIDPAEWRRIDAHVDDCAACQNTLARFARIARALRQPPAMPPSAAVWHGVQRRISLHQRGMSMPNRNLLIAGGLGSAAVLVLMLILVLNLFAAPSGTSTSLTPPPQTPSASATAQPALTPTALAPTPTLTARAATLLAEKVYSDFPTPLLCGVDVRIHQKRWCSTQVAFNFDANIVADENAVYVGYTTASGSGISAHDRLTYQLLWQHAAPTGLIIEPVLLAGNILYAWTHTSSTTITTEPRVMAFDTASGTLLWQSPPLAASYDGVYQPFYYRNGVIYAGDWPRYAGQSGTPTTYALEATTGAVRWQTTTGGGEVLAVSDTLVYTYTPHGISALSATSGNQLWSQAFTKGVTPLVTVATNVLYVEINYTTLYAFDANGQTLWTAPITNDLDEPPVVVGNSVYVLSYFNKALVALDKATGSVQWQQTIPNQCETGLRTWVPQLLLEGSLLFVVDPCASQTTAIQAATGAVAWQTTSRIFATLDGTTYGLKEPSNGAILVAVNLADGSVQWQVPLP